jgi:hypothetical protein
MNRGRHKSNKTSEVIKLARQYGACYPEAWKNNISYKNLIKLINTQKEKCGFNNLHIFETTDFSSTFLCSGGFLWNDTIEGFSFWQNTLHGLYYEIQNYIKISKKPL